MRYKQKKRKQQKLLTNPVAFDKSKPFRFNDQEPEFPIFEDLNFSFPPFSAFTEMIADPGFNNNINLTL